MPARQRRVAHRVYDPVLRLLHAVNGLLIVLLAGSGLVASGIEPGAATAWLHHWHGVLGSTLLVGLSGRLAWGIVGPRHARWRDMWHPAAWRALQTPGALFTAPNRLGHHPVASLVYLGVYLLLLGLGISGLALLAGLQGHGPLAARFGLDAAMATQLSAPHVWAGWAIAAFVPVHLLAMSLHAHLHRVPVAQGMLTGVQYLESK